MRRAEHLFVARQLSQRHDLPVELGRIDPGGPIAPGGGDRRGRHARLEIGREIIDVELWVVCGQPRLRRSVVVERTVVVGRDATSTRRPVTIEHGGDSRPRDPVPRRACDRVEQKRKAGVSEPVGGFGMAGRNVTVILRRQRDRHRRGPETMRRGDPGHAGDRPLEASLAIGGRHAAVRRQRLVEDHRVEVARAERPRASARGVLPQRGSPPPPAATPPDSRAPSQTVHASPTSGSVVAPLKSSAAVTTSRDDPGARSSTRNAIPAATSRPGSASASASGRSSRTVAVPAAASTAGRSSGPPCRGGEPTGSAWTGSPHERESWSGLAKHRAGLRQVHGERARRSGARLGRQGGRPQTTRGCPPRCPGP